MDREYSNHILNAGNALEWDKQQFKLLAFEFDIDLDKLFCLNFKQKYFFFNGKLESRNLTPLGRLAVLKTLLLLQLNHIFAPLPNPSDSQLRDF